MEPLNYNQPWTKLIENKGTLEEMIVIHQSKERVIINNHPWYIQEYRNKRKFIVRLSEEDKRVWELTRINPAHEMPPLWHLRLDKVVCSACPGDDEECDKCEGTGLTRVNA